MTTGYPELVVSKGKGSTIKLTYAEALVDARGKKGNRNEVEGRHIVGLRDKRSSSTDFFFFLRGLSSGCLPVARRGAPKGRRRGRETSAVSVDSPGASAAQASYPARCGSWVENIEGKRPVRGEDIRGRDEDGPDECLHETYMDCPYWGAAPVHRRHPRIQDAHLLHVALATTGWRGRRIDAYEQLADRRRPQPGWAVPELAPTRSSRTFSLFWIGMLA